MKTYKTIDTITKNAASSKRNKNGYTVIELLVTGAALTVAVVGGTLLAKGCNYMARQMNYDEMYNRAAAIADTNKSADLDKEEMRAWFKEMGVVVPHNQSYSELKPSYDKLEAFVEAYE